MAQRELFCRCATSMCSASAATSSCGGSGGQEARRIGGGSRVVESSEPRDLSSGQGAYTMQFEQPVTMCLLSNATTGCLSENAQLDNEQLQENMPVAGA